MKCWIWCVLSACEHVFQRTVDLLTDVIVLCFLHLIIQENLFVCTGIFMSRMPGCVCLRVHGGIIRVSYAH